MIPFVVRFRLAAGGGAAEQGARRGPAVQDGEVRLGPRGLHGRAAARDSVPWLPRSFAARVEYLLTGARTALEHQQKQAPAIHGDGCSQ